MATSTTASTQIVGVRIENDGVQSLSGGVTEFGQAFKQGALPAGSGLVATIGGASVAVQLDVKTTWPDGSAKFAVVSVDRPVLAAGAGVDVVLSKGAAAAGAAVDLAAVSKGHTLTVELTPQDSSTLGGSKVTLDVLDLLRKALADGTASYWQKGVETTEARVEVDLPGSMHLKFDVSAYKDGQISVDAVFANDEAMTASGDAAKYAVVAKLDGAVAISETVSQGQYQTWHREISSGGANGTTGLGDAAHGWLNVGQDVAYLEATGAVPEYDLTVPVSGATLQSYGTAITAATWDDPLSANGVTQYMPQTGGRADIGPTTASNAAWLISGDIRAAEYSLGQAEAAGAVPWNFWDKAHGTWLNTDYYPKLWTDARGGTGVAGNAGSTGLTQQASSNTGWTPDIAHQPDLSTVPYLLTGERWILDNLQAQASATIMGIWPTLRFDGAGNVVNGGQVRGDAWGLREIDNAAWLSPDGSAEKAYFQKVSEANWKWLVSQIPAWTAAQGEAHGWVPGDYREAGGIAPWQQDYFAMTAITAASRGNADALTFLKWEANFLVGRFMNEANGFNWHDGASYSLAVADSVTGSAYTSWAAMGAAQVARGWSLGTGWGDDVNAQLALYTLAGIYDLTGSSAALEAYRKLLGAHVPNTDVATYSLSPTFAVTIPTLFDQLALATPVPPASTGSSSGSGESSVVLPQAPVLTTPQVISIGSGKDVLVLKVSQDFWQESALYTVSINGKQVGDTLAAGALFAKNATDTVTISGDWGNTVTLKVTFLNDGWGGMVGTDRNLYINGVVLNGVDQKYGNALYHSGDYLTLTINNPVTTVSLPIKTSAQMLAGDAAINVLVGGTGADIIEGKGGGDIMAGGAGKDTFIFRPGDGGDRITDFASGTDRILFKGIDPATLKAAAATVNGVAGLKLAYGTGTDNIFLAGVTSLKAGDLVFSDVPATVASTVAAATATKLTGLLSSAPVLTTPQVISIGSGKDVLVLKVSQDFWQESALYTVSINGKQVGDTLAAGALFAKNATDTVTISGDWGNTVTLKVTFLNDGWGSTAKEDRNLYINGVVLNGVDQKYGNALYHSGDYLTLTLTQSSIVLPTPSYALLREGDAAANTLVGGTGNDIIQGKAGADVLTGGVGADTFIFAQGDGADRITDFASGTDRILFKGIDPASLKAVAATVGGVAGTSISYGTGTDTLFLAGVSALKQGDLVFG